MFINNGANGFYVNATTRRRICTRLEPASPATPLRAANLNANCNQMAKPGAFWAIPKIYNSRRSTHVWENGPPLGQEAC